MAKPAGSDCNLGCRYCFYLDKAELFPESRPMRMSAEVLDAFTRQYIEAQPPGAPEVSFAWQGGEPTLLGIEFYERAMEAQRRHTRPGMRITNALQTNGVLLDDDWGRFLRRNGFLVGLSVDGPEELHDGYRRDRGGRGSFRRVMRGLEVLDRQRVEFNTLTVVHRHNARRPREVYEFLKGIGARFLQFIPLVELGPDGAASGSSVHAEDYGNFLNVILDTWLEQGDVGRVFVSDFDTTLGLVAGTSSNTCVQSRECGNALAIEHNGDVFSCDHFVAAPYRLGNVLDGSLGHMVRSAQQRAFGRAKSDLPPECCRCEYLKLCRGGCPKDRVFDRVRDEPGVNYLCPGLRSFFRHSLPVFERMARQLGPGVPAAPREVRPSLGLDPVSSRPAPVGRNRPCPCGSGRKFKRCCGRP